MMLKRNKIMLMPPSIEKTKYMKIYKGTEMKYVKMTKTLIDSFVCEKHAAEPRSVRILTCC